MDRNYIVLEGDSVMLKQILPKVCFNFLQWMIYNSMLECYLDLKEAWTEIFLFFLTSEALNQVPTYNFDLYNTSSVKLHWINYMYQICTKIFMGSKISFLNFTFLRRKMCHVCDNWRYGDELLYFQENTWSKQTLWSNYFVAYMFIY